MDISFLIMILGFSLASYSVVGNDVIQTLGTFLTSNEKRPWWVLFLFAGSILTAVLVYGWLDPYNEHVFGVAYGKLDSFNVSANLEWYYLLPPLVLLMITRLGIPVSTTFMILTLFSIDKISGDSAGEILSALLDWNSKLGGIVFKSLMGYLIAFTTAIAVYLAVTRVLEKRFLENPITKNEQRWWTVAQWLSTGLLWSQWLIQDLANIYIYLRGRGEIPTSLFLFTLFILLALLAYIFYSKGGAVQGIVKAKTNTTDIRSATIIDFIYAIVLLVFKYDTFGIWGKLPMSTTWVFIGLLAGREIGIRLRLEKRLSRATTADITRDLGKVFIGLVVSVVLVVVIKLIGSN